MPFDTLYVIITGAGTARRVPALLPRLTRLAPHVTTVMTENAWRVVSPRELALIPGHQVVESYFDASITPRPPFGVLVVVPCSFDSLNKLAYGVADTLALSIVAEAIGRRTPVVIAVSVNVPLWAHPRAQESVATLRSWGCDVIEPEPIGELITLASDDRIVAAVEAAFREGTATDRS